MALSGFSKFFPQVTSAKGIGVEFGFSVLSTLPYEIWTTMCTPVFWNFFIKILYFRILDINSSCKTCVSHLLEYIVVYIIVGVSSLSRGICELSGSGEAQEVVSFPHSSVSSPDALFWSSNAMCTWPLPGTWYKVHSFERIIGAKWL